MYVCVYEYIHIKLTMIVWLKKNCTFHSSYYYNIQIMQKTGHFLQKVSAIQSSKQ